MLAFTGAMDYWPNVEAVTWFADEVLPLVRRERPTCASRSSAATRPTRCARSRRATGVIVTGRVPDVRPYLRHAAVAVAPLRIARGIQNKVLEALAMARPVVCTPAAAEGLRASPLVEAATAESPAELAAKVIANLQRGEVRAHRDYVVAHYGWDANLSVRRSPAGRPGRRPAAATIALESA